MLNSILLKNFFDLGRFDKPTGAILLLLPCLWGLSLVQGLFFNWTHVLIFTIGAFTMRAAGCVINDYFDQQIDRQVQRTQSRPLATKLISNKQAFIFLGLLCLFGFSFLIQLPTDCWYLSFFAAFLAVIYPLAKRYTPFPQVVLGLTFNLGIPIGAASATSEWSHPSVWLTYTAAILWTIAYDTIYALQDITDDIRLNVGSTAVLFGNSVMISVGICYFLMHIILFFVLNQLKSGPTGYTLIFFSFYYTLYNLIKLDKNNPENCRDFFVKNNIIGSIIWLSLTLR